MKISIRLRKIGGGLFFLLLTGVLSAQGVFTLFSENDSRFNKPNGATDRHYTNGTKLVYAFQPSWQWLEDFGNWGRPADASAVTGVGFFLGQTMYTPDYPDRPWMRRDYERVFAGWLYTGMFVQRRIDDVLDHIELNVGVVGPSAHADNTQRFIHDCLHSGRPIGWDNQIGDEPAANLIYVRKHRHADGLFSDTTRFDAITDIGFTAGSLFRRFEAGLMLRCGLTALPDDFGPGRLAVPHSGAAMDTERNRALYLFGRVSGRAIEHDRFLTGLSPEPFVGLAEVGIVCRYDNLELAYSQTFLTREFKQQQPKDSFGAITLTWLF